MGLFVIVTDNRLGGNSVTMTMGLDVLDRSMEADGLHRCNDVVTVGLVLVVVANDALRRNSVSVTAGLDLVDGF